MCGSLMHQTAWYLSLIFAGVVIGMDYSPFSALLRCYIKSYHYVYHLQICHMDHSQGVLFKVEINWTIFFNHEQKPTEMD